MDEKKVPYTEDRVPSDVENGDVNSGYDGSEFDERKDLRRGLKQRHIQMIALAGTIGTVGSLPSFKGIMILIS